MRRASSRSISPSFIATRIPSSIKLLSQGALAADAGIYQELVSRIENGAANPELDTLGKIAAALGVYPREPLDE